MDLFDLFMPLSVLSLVLLILTGPLIFPRPYLLFLAVAFPFFVALHLMHFFKFKITNRRIRQTLSKINMSKKSLISPTTAVSPLLVDGEAEGFHAPVHKHVFILPNYEESVCLLHQTISFLAAHSFSNSHYVLVLAMEESEHNALHKANGLKEKFSSQFLDILITQHPQNIVGESRGKGPNVNYAAQKACSYISSSQPLRSFMITVMDADSQIPELYVQELETQICLHGKMNIFCPPIFFSRNAHKVPAMVRITDIMWSIMVMQNLSGIRGLAFPCSNYSLAASLAHDVNYWDTNFEAIGEDMHMTLKCFFKTNGECRTKAVHVPINMTNVQSDGYYSTIKARHQQAIRHFYGAADVAYTLRSATKLTYTPALFLDVMWVVFLMFEAHLAACISGYFFLFAIPILEYTLPSTLSPFYQKIFLFIKIVPLLGALPMILNFLRYHALHQYIDSVLWQKQTRFWYHLGDLVWLPLSGFLFLTVPSTSSSIRTLMRRGNQEYIVSEKKIDED